MTECLIDFKEKTKALVFYETGREKEMIRSWLEELDFQVSAVKSIKTATRSLRANDPDIIIAPPVIDNEIITTYASRLESLVESRPAVAVIAKRGQMEDLRNLSQEYRIDNIYERPLNKNRFIAMIKKTLGMDTPYEPKKVPFREGLDDMGMFERTFAFIDPLNERETPNELEKRQFFQKFKADEQLGQLYLDEMVENITGQMWGTRKIRNWGENDHNVLSNIRQVMEFYSEVFPPKIQIPAQMREGLKWVSYLKDNNPPKGAPQNFQKGIHEELKVLEKEPVIMKMMMLEHPRNIPLYLIQVRGSKGYKNAELKIKDKMKEFIQPDMTVYDMRRLKRACIKSADYFAMTLFCRSDDQVKILDEKMMFILEDIYNITDYTRRDKLADRRRTYIKYRVPMFHPLNMEILIGSFQTRVAETEMFGPNRRINYALRKGKTTR